MHTKTMALVLKNANYRDYDRMLTLFSGDMGRVDVLARGCRKQNSPLLPLSSVFACGEFYLAQKGDRYYLEQGVLKDSFFELRGKMSALTVAMTMTEVAERVVMPEQPNKRLFALMVNALFYLAREGIPEDIFVFFVFKLLDILGLRPLTDRCIACGAEKIVAADKDGDYVQNVLPRRKRLLLRICRRCSRRRLPEYCLSMRKRGKVPLRLHVTGLRMHWNMSRKAL